MGRKRKSPQKPRQLPKAVALSASPPAISETAEDGEVIGSDLASPDGKIGSSSTQLQADPVYIVPPTVDEFTATQPESTRTTLSPSQQVSREGVGVPPLAPVSRGALVPAATKAGNSTFEADLAWPPLPRAASGNGRSTSPAMARTPHESLDSPHRAVPLNSNPASTPLVVANQTSPVAATQGKTGQSKINSEKSAPIANAPTGNSKSQLAKQVVKSWAECVTNKSKSLQMRGDKYRDESGDLCVTIPNAVITRNKKVWANFVLGQFHGTLPSMGALHAILNGIWSNKARDIAISRVGTQSVLIKIPNGSTRKRVLEQGVWHVEGQSMFVAAWEPGLQLEIPELKEVPVWIDFKGVPLHFFSEEGLEYIASLVGQPLQLHPRTAGMLNLEVARVFTLVDLTQTLPEAVYVAFESGEKQRIEISCPWLPPKCSHCQQLGHSLRRCPTAPILCNNCKSTTHEALDCFRSKPRSGPPPRRQETRIWKPVSDQATKMPNQPQIPHVDKHADTEVEVETTQATSDAQETMQVPDQATQTNTQPQGSKTENPTAATLLDKSNPSSKNVDTQEQTRNGTAALATRPKHSITIKEPSLSECLPKTLSKVDGKGKTKVMRHSSSDNDSSEDTDDGAGVRHELAETSRNKGKAKVITEPLFSEYDSYDLTDDDFNEHMLLSKLKQKSGRKAKGRVSSAKLFSKR